MFSQKQRLNTSLFDEVFNFGKTKPNKLFLVKYKKNNLEFSRFAVVVSKKKVSSAVKRHLIKRRFFNAIKETGLLNKGYDVIFILNKEVENMSFDDLILIINKIELE